MTGPASDGESRSAGEVAVQQHGPVAPDPEIERYRRELADYDARRRASRYEYPAWRRALDDLFCANYANDAFWLNGDGENGLLGIMGGEVSEDDMRLVRAWFAARCRICERPMHETDVRRRECRHCGAGVAEPVVIEGSIAGLELGGGQ